MTDDETLALMLLLVADGPMSVSSVASGLHGSNGIRQCQDAKRTLKSLHDHGAVCCVNTPLGSRRHVWRIAEKGRIACALAMFKDRSLYHAFFDEAA